METHIFHLCTVQTFSRVHVIKETRYIFTGIKASRVKVRNLSCSFSGEAPNQGFLLLLPPPPSSFSSFPPILGPQDETLRKKRRRRWKSTYTQPYMSVGNGHIYFWSMNFLQNVSHPEIRGLDLFMDFSLS